MKKAGVIKHMGCPNCFRRLTGVTDSEGGMRLVCDRCGVYLYSKQISPRTYIIKVTNTK